MSPLAVAVVMFVAVAALIYYVGVGVTRARGRGRERLMAMQDRTELLERSFAERAVAPIVQGLGSWVLRYTPQGWVGRTRDRLALAGWSDTFDVNAWAAVRILTIVTALALFFVLPGDYRGFQLLLLIALLGFGGFILPEAILNRRIEQRREAMRRELPEILDLLVISVEAGLSFDAALSRVVQAVPGEMSSEFNRMLQETRVGVSRRDALDSLAGRTDVDELQSFLLAMNQADAFGVSIVRVLRVQSEEMRNRRRQRAQERAFAAPVKMVFPLVLCIFPAIFVVLLGPAFIEIRRVLLT